MKTAFSYWNKRIAPMFDTALQVRLVEAEAGKVVGDQLMTMSALSPAQRIVELRAAGVESLVCGAVSKGLRGMLVSYGIQVVPFVAGDLDEIVAAWINGQLEPESFAMPGCGGRRRCLTGGTMDKRGFGPGRGGKAGRGAGGGGNRQSGRGAGRASGGSRPGSAGMCRCLSCGHAEPHETGVPCWQKSCPVCGNAMTRQ